MVEPTFAELRPDGAAGQEHAGRGRLARAVPLLVVLVGALGLRLASIQHGLPFSYNPDEESHFVPPAAQAADGQLDPGYFENPSGLTYLLALVLRLAFVGRSVSAQLVADPTGVFTVARTTVALVGTLLVLVVFWAGRRYFGRAAGLVAAATMAFGFLPVFYSHQALNDVPTLVPATVALVCALRVYERGDARSYVLAGAALGVAAAFKYNAAPIALVVALASALRTLRLRERPQRAIRLLALAAVVSVGALVALNPFIVLDFGAFYSQYREQSDGTGSAKLGQSGTGWAFYARSLLWGFGAVPAVFALVGAVLALRADWRRALLLVAFPVALYLYLSVQGRFFARWFLPSYPALAILAGYGVVRTAARLRALVSRRAARRGLGAIVLPVLAVLVVLPSLAASARNDRVLGHVDTRTQARDWVLANVGGNRHVIVEPSIPFGYLEGVQGFTTLPVDRRFESYEPTLDAGLVDAYRAQGYCWVMVSSFQRDRGLAAGLPGARAYYARLAAEAASTTVFSPYRAGATAPPFDFDLSFDWYPRAYERPGPTVEVIRLRDCPAPAGVGRWPKIGP